MKVLLKRTLFSQGRRWKPSIPADHPVEMPDWMRDKLPADAVIVGDTYKPPSEVLVQEPQTMAEVNAAQKHKSVADALADASAKAQASADALAKSKDNPGQWPPDKEDQPNA